MTFKTFTIALLSSIILSCTTANDWYSGDYFFLKNKEAVMPIWVTGNIDSNIFVITNHDGPGGISGHDFHKSTGFKELEKKYGIVYWDQRMSGLSQGDAFYSELTIGLHTEDLQKLITLIEVRYKPKALFLYGNGWGSGIALDFLSKKDNQKKIRGFINENGFINDSLEQIFKKEWILPRAQKNLAETEDPKWLKMIDWYKNNPTPTEANPEPFEFIHQLEGYYFDEAAAREVNNVPENQTLFNSAYSVGWKTNQYKNRAFIANYNFENAAKKVTLPTLLIWGVENGAVPVKAGDYTYNLLGTPETEKTLLKLDKCGHYPHLEKPFTWYDVVTAFIEENK